MSKGKCRIDIEAIEREHKKFQERYNKHRWEMMASQATPIQINADGTIRKNQQR